MHFLQAINSDLSVLIDCNKTGGTIKGDIYIYINVLLAVHLSISLDNDQLDTHFLYFTIRPLQSPTCFEHYMLIIRRLNCIDAASGIVLSVSGRPVYRLRKNRLESNQFSVNLYTGRPLT